MRLSFNKDFYYCDIDFEEDLIFAKRNLELLEYNIQMED